MFRNPTAHEARIHRARPSEAGLRPPATPACARAG
ncbi:hypothetical protein [Inquilinus sp. YAF38]